MGLGAVATAGDAERFRVSAVDARGEGGGFGAGAAARSFHRAFCKDRAGFFFACPVRFTFGLQRRRIDGDDDERGAAARG